MKTMKTQLNLFRTRPLDGALVALCLVFIVQAKAEPALPQGAAPNPSAPIPWSEIGAKAGADYQGEGLSVKPAANGARLRCVFQRLEGEATTEGLWLFSTVTNAAQARFRVVASSVGRNFSMVGDEVTSGVRLSLSATT